jgi:hypothetical protein
LALTPEAVTRNPAIPSPPDTGSTVRVPPRETVPAAISNILSNSFTRFFASNSGGADSRRTWSYRPQGVRARLFPHRRGRSARRPIRPRRRPAGKIAVCAEAWYALFLIRSSAKVLVSSSLSSSMTSMPIDDRADGADQVMAEARAQKRCKIEGSDGYRWPETGADMRSSAQMHPRPCHSPCDSAIVPSRPSPWYRARLCPAHVCRNS